ncbi:MAG: hypothetical protein AAF901_11280 [Bacteroidota bacterium]
MNKTYYCLYLTLLCLVCNNKITAQEWSFGGEVGATLFSGFQYTPAEQEGGFLDRGYKIPHNEGWILSYYPANRPYFFTAAYTRFHPNTSNLVAESNVYNLRECHAGGPFNHTISLNMGYQFDVGKFVSLKSEHLFFEPIYGVGIELLRNYTPVPLNLVLFKLQSQTHETGINPSLQAGFRLSYRYRRSKFSVKTLGNLGLRYHTESEYRVLLPEETILTTTRSKSDFIAAQVSYEYIFKSNKIEKRKRAQKDHLQKTSDSHSIHELKVGVNPFHLSRMVGLNYELFLAETKKSLFIDFTYLNILRGLETNISANINQPEYVFSTFKHPTLDLKVGQNIFSETYNNDRWAIGYYLRSEVEMPNRAYDEVFRDRFNASPAPTAVYVGLGSALQYKWVLANRWSVTPMFFMDIGLGNRSANVTNHRLSGNSLYFDAQARLYVGYRF